MCALQAAKSCLDFTFTFAEHNGYVLCVCIYYNLEDAWDTKDCKNDSLTLSYMSTSGESDTQTQAALRASTQALWNPLYL